MPFFVVIGRDHVVMELKEKIQEKLALGTLKEVDPTILNLWKVSAIDES